jgi:hypothetical protein
MSQLTETFFVVIHFAVAALPTRVRRGKTGRGLRTDLRPRSHEQFICC